MDKINISMPNLVAIEFIGFKQLFKNQAGFIATQTKTESQRRNSYHTIRVRQLNCVKVFFLIDITSSKRHDF